MSINENLDQIYKEVENDIQNMPKTMKTIHTTEDFFGWRDKIKRKSNENSSLRNEIVEKTIKGNASLELLYDWTKFYRILDNAKARVFLLKEEMKQEEIYDEEVVDEIHFSSTCPLHNYLSKKKKGNIEGLFKMTKIGGFGFRYNEFPTFHTPYEFLQMITHEEIYGPFAIDILVCLLRAYGIKGEDLLCCGREIEKEADTLIQTLKEDTPLKRQEKVYYRK